MREKGISVRIHPAGAVIFAAAVLLFDSRRVLSSAAALVMHEGAHLFAMRLCGMKTCTIELTPFGGMADVPALGTAPPWKQILCAAAGIFESSLMAWLCLCFAPRTVFGRAFFEAHFSLALINLLPAWPLDGARVLTSIAAAFGVERSAKKVLSWMTTGIGAAFVGLGLYGIWQGIFNPSLLVAGPYLCYAAHAENVTSKVRRLEAAGSKLEVDAVYPVKIWAGNSGEVKRGGLGILIGKMDQAQYHLFLQVDDGQITKVWTEEEMLSYVLDHGRKRQTENMDKE